VHKRALPTSARWLVDTLGGGITSNGIAGGRVVRTVLIVDDDADVLDAVAEVLVLEGFAVRQARGGAAALDVLRTERAPGVVLLDARMEDVDGRTVWQWIRTNPATCGVPVVFMTADRRFQPLDGASVLEKPFGVADLLDAVRIALESC